VITTDTEGKVTFLNPVAEMMTGWKTAEASASLWIKFSTLSVKTLASRRRIRWI
jgi:hypothetical protein